ncbi:Alpha/Beta hydrolase protein [Aspergillus carlsbadensis]|nr:Alpha/Beta hydrolase protein [Aspergillus carlsbadensis]
MSTNSSAHAWRSLPEAVSPALKKLNHLLDNDPQWQAFIHTEGIHNPVTMGIHSTGSDDAIIVSVEPSSRTTVSTGRSSQADFALVAQPEHWESFFSESPKAPFTSFVGIQVAEADEDHLTGKYAFINPPVWGKTKVFYKTSGTGPQEIVFLHTAGSDSRQYHGVMNDATMRSKCTMYAFDLPAHGRSFPGKNHLPGNHTNTEESYVGAIRKFIKILKLNKPIVCGASMAGQVCIAVAIRAEEVGAGGTIPLQGCDYLTMKRQFNDKSPVINQSLFNPDWIYGMMAPSAPLVNKQLIWHLYSAQAYGIFHGDLDFYFGSFDARDRVASIDVKKCPIYFLTGEFDLSTTPQVSEATAKKIKGANFKAMEGLGHFPATESPARFIPYLLEAIDWIQKTRA